MEQCKYEYLSGKQFLFPITLFYPAAPVVGLDLNARPYPLGPVAGCLLCHCAWISDTMYVLTLLSSHHKNTARDCPPVWSSTGQCGPDSRPETIFPAGRKAGLAGSQQYPDLHSKTYCDSQGSPRKTSRPTVGMRSPPRPSWLSRQRLGQYDTSASKWLLISLVLRKPQNKCSHNLLVMITPLRFCHVYPSAPSTCSKLSWTSSFSNRFYSLWRFDEQYRSLISFLISFIFLQHKFGASYDYCSYFSTLGQFWGQVSFSFSALATIVFLLISAYHLPSNPFLHHGFLCVTEHFECFITLAS